MGYGHCCRHQETHADVAAAGCCGGSLKLLQAYKALFFADLVAACILAGVDLALQLLNFFTASSSGRPPGHLKASGSSLLLFIALYAARTGCQWFHHLLGSR